MIQVLNNFTPISKFDSAALMTITAHKHLNAGEYLMEAGKKVMMLRWWSQAT